MKTLIDLFETFNSRRKTAFVYRTGIRRFTFSYKDFYNLSLRMASFLEKQNIKKGDRVLLWAPNSPWWAVAFWGIIIRGAIVVPVDFISGKERVEKIAKLTKSRLIIQSHYKLEKIKGQKTVMIEDLQFLLPNEKPAQKIVKPKPSNIVELVYTSGTTGNPKGVILTHQNLVANLKQLNRHIKISSDYNLLSLLPLSHMFEQMTGFLVPLWRGAKIIYLRTLKPSAIMEGLKEEDIYIMVAVPRLLQALKNSIERKFAAKGLGKTLEKLLALTKDKPLAIKKLIFFMIHKQFGKNFKFFLSGGAALDIIVGRFWQSMGFTVIEGYGLTECSPVLTANDKNKQLLGSVGKTLAEVRIKIVNGEILAKGRNIFTGYWQNKKASKEAFTKDGWFKTGDEGTFDHQGNLFIKGRKKDVIITSSGVNVYPDEVETALSHIEGVKECCVVGLNQGEGEEVHAVLLLENNISPEVVIQKANENLDPQQQITGFTLWQGGDLPKTPTLKIQKFKVKEALVGKPKINGQHESDKLITLISKVSGKPTNEVKEQSLLVSDLGITSIGRVELVSYIEQEYRVDLEDTAINQYTTVAKLRDIIDKRESHDTPLRLVFYPYKPWAIWLREFMNTILQRPLFSYFIHAKSSNMGKLAKINPPVIFIANHISYFDYMPFAMVLPRKWRERTATASREEFFFSEGSLFSRLGKRIMLEYMMLFGNVFLLPQKRGFRKSLSYMGKLIDKDVSILLFPEGERSWDGKLLPFMAGLGLIVKELQAPVVPVKISGMEKVLPRGASKINKGNVRVTFGDPLVFTTETPSEIIEKSRTALFKL